MANNKKTKFSPLFPNKPPSPGDISPNSGVSETDINSLIPSLDHRYQTGDASTILFLSKRGMSRSPLAREVLREKNGCIQRELNTDLHSFSGPSYDVA